MILQCLRDDRYRIHDDGIRYLNLKAIRAQYIIDDLIEDLALYHIFELPPQTTNQNKNTGPKYQYAISYTAPDITIHIKFSPKNTDPPIIYLGFHSHNTGHAPLPQIPLNPDSPKS